MIHFTVGVYQSKKEGLEEWTAMIPVTQYAYQSGQGETKLRERMIDRLRQVLREAPPQQQELYQLPLGTELERVPFDLKLDGGRVTGVVPLIVEPRWVSADKQILVCYHPERRTEWFPAEDRNEIAALSILFFRHYWKAMDEECVRALMSNGRDRLIQVAFSTEAKSLLDMLPSRKKDTKSGAFSTRSGQVLQQIAIDETHRLSGPPADQTLGVPRSPYRERLNYLLGGPRPRCVAVIGLPGTGKTVLIQQWIHDRLVEDGFTLHKNLDRCFHVWRLTGKRMIAGMSHLGQWEERCLGLLDEASRRKGILWIEDLHLWGRLGQSRQSERSFADFFRGPARRGDLAIVAEMTPEQFARLERDAPGLAEALSPVVVPAASAAETAHLLLHEVRALEMRLPVALHPFVPRTALELGASLFPWRARPGVAIEIVRRVAELGAAANVTRELAPGDVLDYLARTTGLSPSLISLEQPLDVDDVEALFAARVIGQPRATRAAADVILKVRAGLADPNRPIHVMLFTGPTGTGKTELATAIAECLYGAGERLLRVDMGELSGPDAVSRLIGDRFDRNPAGPEGLLTSRIRAQPFSVVLLDEIEKAHPQALHLLLQLFDEGRLTDAAGEVASFASAVVIMTSNLGSRSAAPIGFGDTRDRILADVAKAVRDFFPIELFNRIDEVVAFQPLTHEVAAKIVDKELAKLLARRGLRERNTFVYAGSAVRRRAVADAFDPRYGARTVKRWLEDQIGGALTDLLAAAPPARLRVVRLSEYDGTLVATLEPMIEKPSLPGAYLLESSLDVATAGLEPLIEMAVVALNRIAASPIHQREAEGELRYYVDELEQRVTALREMFGVTDHTPQGARVDEIDAVDPGPRDDDEPQYKPRVLSPSWTGKQQRRVRLRSNSGRATRPPASRDALLAGIAETMLIERALPRLLDPDAHAVTVLISRVGTTADAGGLGIVTSALAQPGWLDEGGFLDADRQLHPLAGKKSDLTKARDVVLVLRGLFVHEALANEHGIWMIRAAAAEPDIVRVEIRPGASAKPPAILKAHLAGRAELERVLEHGGAMPPNPDVLLPVARTITYRPPIRPGEAYHVEIEDFGTGWVDRGNARDLGTAIRRAWHLAWSRR